MLNLAPILSTGSTENNLPPLHAADKRIEEEAEGHLQQLKGPFQAPWIIWVTRLISPRLR